MRKFITLLAIAGMVLALAPTAQAVIIDIGASGQTVLSTAQGWTPGIAATGINEQSTTFDVGLDIGVIATLRSLATGVNSAQNNSPQWGGSDLTTDWYRNKDYTGDSGSIRNTLTLSGLSEGSYTWNGYHGHGSGTRRMIIDVLVDGTPVDTAVAQASNSTGFTFADGAGLSSVTFTSSGITDEIVIGFQKNSGSAAAANSTEIYLNGFSVLGTQTMVE